MHSHYFIRRVFRKAKVKYTFRVLLDQILYHGCSRLKNKIYAIADCREKRRKVTDSSGKLLMWWGPYYKEKDHSSLRVPAISS